MDLGSSSRKLERPESQISEPVDQQVLEASSNFFVFRAKIFAFPPMPNLHHRTYFLDNSKVSRSHYYDRMDAYTY